ncbi:MAG TPA: protein-glutamate O-methyltransferase CheR [Gemmataceae bacterium]|jgi:chemotaxis protein methyltransferase CheR|nr:protein-glutamate O-methyltransferase CheR [Gemmataceae bacterium]
MSAPPDTEELEAIEVQLLLEAIFRRYGFDFRNYAQPSICRRIWSSVHAEGLETISELQGKLLHDAAAMERFLLAVTVNVSTMFRDPDFYRAFRSRVAPALQACPFVRIWHVGCATGEEVYSMAILLHEEGLYPRCRIYATDMNEAVLAKAKAGIFSPGLVQEYTTNYLQAGGTGCFSEYYTANYGNVIFDRALIDNIVFAQHNLVTDGSFNEFQVILCRNVMIYFNDLLTRQVHELLYQSLALSGFLGLGDKESIKFTPREDCYEEFDGHERLYRRIK